MLKGNHFTQVPSSKPVKPRFYAITTAAPFPKNGTRSTPAEIESTGALPRYKLPVAKEHPAEISTATGSLEPAREPSDSPILAGVFLF